MNTAENRYSGGYQEQTDDSNMGLATLALSSPYGCFNYVLAGNQTLEAYTEQATRRKIQFSEAFTDLIAVAARPADFVSIAGGYEMLRGELSDRHYKESSHVQPGALAGDMLRRAAILHEDEHTGMAEVDAVVRTIQPAISRLTDSVALQDIYNNKSKRPGPVSLHGRIFTGLRDFPAGSVEYVAATRLIGSYGAASGRGRPSEAIARIKQEGQSYQAERYLSSRALKHLKDQKIGCGEIPLSTESIRLMDSLVDTSLSELARTDPNARQLKRVYEQLKDRLHRSAQTSDVSELATLALAQTPAVTAALPQYEIDGQPVPYDSLASRDFSRMPDAYLRLLHWIHPDLVQASLSGGVYDGSVWRKRFIFMDALAQQYKNEHLTRHIRFGDKVMQLAAQGQHPLLAYRQLVWQFRDNAEKQPAPEDPNQQQAARKQTRK